MPGSDTAMSVPAPGHLQVIQYQQQAADRDPDERERPIASALKCPRYPQYQRYLLDERYHASPQDRYVATRFGSQGRREEYHREQQLEEHYRNQGQHEGGYPQPGVPCPHLGQATSLPKNRGCRTLFTGVRARGILRSSQARRSPKLCQAL